MVSLTFLHFPGLLETLWGQETCLVYFCTQHQHFLTPQMMITYQAIVLELPHFAQPFMYFGFEFKDISNIFIFVTTATREI